MKNYILKLLLVIPVLVLSLCLLACDKDPKLTDFQKFVSTIYDSEATITGYNEEACIIDGEMVVFSRITNFKLERKESVKSEVTIVDKTLSTTGNEQYVEKVDSFTTVDNIKYTVVNGKTFENEYVMPTYYLTFMISEDYLEEGYELNINGSDYTLKAKVIDNKISSVFLNKSLGNIKGMDVEIVIKDGKLQTFNATYTTENNLKGSIKTSYLY